MRRKSSSVSLAIFCSFVVEKLSLGKDLKVRAACIYERCGFRYFRTDFFAPDGNDTTEEFSPTQAVVFNSLDFFMTLYQGYLFIFFQIFFLY